ncbi:MAG TPA: imidazole glycerol phosphate synthase subunit HisH [Flavobacteriaceae bacterium]|jgi:glutamine amidotransferase|nr:imidazole glycerol phosphate synthase subunit HisH [Flavobacteriaceae bacterium]MDA9280233.1 imidazole glycerol phosphate synthase subunit HisH [Flavobacteriaceae bacterium]MDA9364470.1 imidazole glycerol phosphate synthase subunit HisH [Flavobacteriaceae bacterium]MDC1218552.1 imidazole glycerol phosphate synthase subunit HisH [Flavobacteriaceae bacterium]MDC1301406.1 imidazole glycerol phosphate synthase subunit HisH [Flavobacteriaceae bacterium]|tara:strand:- start:915 stop:1496 length:582 start_codon:yes stop_codon:yes gene_type:complete
MNVVIVDYGAGNIQSVLFALERQGVKAVLSNELEVIEKADKVIFPGVGHAAAAMEKLQASGIDTLLPRLKQPLLGICLGMQLMCSHSEEGNTNGLGIFDVEVIAFEKNLKVPHIGWNSIEQLQGPIFKGIDNGSYIYMVHSYYAALSSETIAVCHYDVAYSAALAKDNFFGTQFHPEKSSVIGNKILKNFLAI